MITTTTIIIILIALNGLVLLLLANKNKQLEKEITIYKDRLNRINKGS